MKACVKIIMTALSILALSSAASCSHKDIECPYGTQKIHIVFDWSHAPGADVTGMTLFFYSQENGAVRQFDIAGRDGGDVALPIGTYRMIACNNDLPGIMLEGTGNLSSIRAVAARRVSEGIYAGTGMLYSTTLNFIEVTPCGVRYTTPAGSERQCGRGMILCTPDSAATQYTVKFNHVSGIGSLRSSRAILEGVTTSMYLESQRPSDTPAAVAINMSENGDKTVLSGRGCAFAGPETGFSQYRLALQVTANDGRNLEKRMELEAGNINFLTRHNVIITVEGVHFPDGGSSEDVGGIGVDVEGWEVIDIDLEPSF